MRTAKTLLTSHTTLKIITYLQGGISLLYRMVKDQVMELVASSKDLPPEPVYNNQLTFKFRLLYNCMNSITGNAHMG